MAVQVTLEFTDAQWELVEKHFPHTSLGREETLPLTPDSFAANLFTIVERLMVKCLKEKLAAQAVDGFNV